MRRGIGDFDDRRTAELGRKAAQRDHHRRRPRDEDVARFWAPAFRDAYDEQRRRLGGCAPEGHDWKPDRVRSETPAMVRRLRPLGALIEVCGVCGVFRDRRRGGEVDA